MEKKEVNTLNNSIYFIALVAIVAIVAIIVLFKFSANSASVSETNLIPQELATDDLAADSLETNDLDLAEAVTGNIAKTKPAAQKTVAERAEPLTPKPNDCNDKDNSLSVGTFKLESTFTASSTMWKTILKEDSCDKNKKVLTEYFCVDDRLAQTDEVCANGCVNGKCLQYTCTDSDKGKNQGIKGKTKSTFDNKVYEDTCKSGGNQLEYYCDAENYVKSEEKPCPSGECFLGECKIEKCSDSDDPNGAGDATSQIYLKGEAKLIGESAGKWDMCADSAESTIGKAEGSHLIEYYCKGGKFGSSIEKLVKYCGGYCYNGACLMKTGSCLDYDSEDKGAKKGFTMAGNGAISHDECYPDGKSLMEYTCSKTDPAKTEGKIIKCNCQNGACVN